MIRRPCLLRPGHLLPAYPGQHLDLQCWQKPWAPASHLEDPLALPVQAACDLQCHWWLNVQTVVTSEMPVRWQVLRIPEQVVLQGQRPELLGQTLA